MRIWSIFYSDVNEPIQKKTNIIEVKGKLAEVCQCHLKKNTQVIANRQVFLEATMIHPQKLEWRRNVCIQI